MNQEQHTKPLSHLKPRTKTLQSCPERMLLDHTCKASLVVQSKRRVTGLGKSRVGS